MKKEFDFKYKPNTTNMNRLSRRMWSTSSRST